MSLVSQAVLAFYYAGLMPTIHFNLENKRFVGGARGRREPDLLPRAFIAVLLWRYVDPPLDYP